MARCWCGKKHGKGSHLNGELKHFVLNWKLYQLRAKDGEQERQKPPPPLEPAAV